MGPGEFARLAWIVPALPLAAFLVIGLAGRWIVDQARLRLPRSANPEGFLGWLGVAAVGAAFAHSLLILFDVLAGARVNTSVPWLPLSAFISGWKEAPYPTAIGLDRPDVWNLPIGMQVDPLTAVMLVVVASVSFLVQIYSIGYVPGDPQAEHHDGPGLRRYFAFISLFTAAMLGLVLANNLLAIYICWELVGLGSYLLIAHWYRKPEAAAAAKKAFVVTRIGDVGFMLGIVFLYWHARTLDISLLTRLVEAGSIPQDALTVAMLLIFCGAIGKSAQFPLHVWLPDAMEGPTPVSALIHAATMVAAGVYLMARTFPLLEHAPAALMVVAVVGGFTALFAATLGLVATDIKRVLAYSTVSQLGYMLLGIGVGAMSAGVFHLFNHAFFKALLFLCAGSVIHLTETNDLFKMGGLRLLRPVTQLTMLIGALSLAGFFPLSGFWSKDEILVAAASKQPVLFLMALATVALTAFYMFRAFFLTFSGRYRGEHEPQRDEREPVTMTLPLVVLLVPTIISGVWGLPFLGNPFGAFLEGHEAHVDFRLDVAVLSNALAAAGLFFAWKLYGDGATQRADALSARVRPLKRLLEHGYYLDRPVAESATPLPTPPPQGGRGGVHPTPVAVSGPPRRWYLYDWLVETVFLGIARAANWFDGRVVDGAVNVGGGAVLGIGSWTRRLQTGQVQTYGWALFAGAVALALIMVIPRIAARS